MRIHHLSRHLPGLAVLLLATLVSLPGSARAQGEALPANFQLTPVIVDVFEPGRPIGFSELPDGRFLIIERNSGHVRVHAPGDSTAPIIGTVDDVPIEGERGLLGIAVDPDWPSRPYVYLYYSHFTPETEHLGRLTMYTAAGDLSSPSSNNLLLTAPYHLLTDLPDSSDIHNGGTLRFGPDKMLYLSLGDDNRPCYAQDNSVLAGKILRLDVSNLPLAGPGPPGKSVLTPPNNPMGGPGENERLVYASGLRNPYRFTIDPWTSDLFIGDVGLVSYEEIDRIVPNGGGENFGWPQWEGFHEPGTGLTCGAGNTFEDPIYEYPHAGWTAVVGGPIYRPGAGSRRFPSYYNGRLFIMDFGLGWIRCLQNNGGGWGVAPVVPMQPHASNWGVSFIYYADMQIGSDGALYLMRLVPQPGRPSGLYRIEPVPQDPVATAPPAELLPGAAPNPVRLGEPVEIRWARSPDAMTVLRILDVSGRSIWSGPVRDDNTAVWNGRSFDGRLVPAGVYFYSLGGPTGFGPSGRVVLIR